MTVQELYDQLSDEQLREALTTKIGYKEILIKYAEMINRNPLDVMEKCDELLTKQAATRWLKNQRKCK